VEHAAVSWWLAEKLRGWEERRMHPANPIACGYCGGVSGHMMWCPRGGKVMTVSRERLELELVHAVERLDEAKTEIEQLKEMLCHRIAAEAEVARGAAAAERERCRTEIERLKDELHAAKAALGSQGRTNLERYMKVKRAAIRKGE